ncbi:MAG: Prolipoprotein diacylglyceryl transferase, partial [uncultured Rubrobacteraceae bacterium]
ELPARLPAQPAVPDHLRGGALRATLLRPVHSPRHRRCHVDVGPRARPQGLRGRARPGLALLYHPAGVYRGAGLPRHHGLRPLRRRPLARRHRRVERGARDLRRRDRGLYRSSRLLPAQGDQPARLRRRRGPGPGARPGHRPLGQLLQPGALRPSVGATVGHKDSPGEQARRLRRRLHLPPDLPLREHLERARVPRVALGGPPLRRLAQGRGRPPALRQPLLHGALLYGVAQDRPRVPDRGDHPRQPARRDRARARLRHDPAPPPLPPPQATAEVL